jgi:hypothetical protein
MKRLYIFRTNLKNLEYYHNFKDLETFKLKCHDFYLLQGIWFLENNYFDEVIIWRQSDKKIEDIIFNVNGKQFIQRWVFNFNEVLKYPKPDISFFRGGFPEFCEVTKKNPKFFGLKLYLGAGPRLLPKYGGIYDKILIEDEKDNVQSNCVPFYKTTNHNIFKPLNLQKKYDICLVSNIKQPRKGTEFIINEISKSKFLKSLNICHLGEYSNIGIELCKKLNVININFLGYKDKEEMNYILNQSKFGLVSANRNDGCPRVITEILTSGTPLLIRDQTRLLNYYKQFGVVEFSNLNFEDQLKYMFNDYPILTKKLNDNLDRFSMEKICILNLNLWKNLYPKK